MGLELFWERKRSIIIQVSNYKSKRFLSNIGLKPKALDRGRGFGHSDGDGSPQNFFAFGSGGGARTHDQLVNSQLLYH